MNIRIFPVVLCYVAASNAAAQTAEQVLQSIQHERYEHRFDNEFNQWKSMIQLKISNPAFQQLLNDHGSPASEQAKEQIFRSEARLGDDLLTFNQFNQQPGRQLEKQQFMQQLIGEMMSLNQQIKVFEQLKQQEIFALARQNGRIQQPEIPVNGAQSAQGNCWSKQVFVPQPTGPGYWTTRWTCSNGTTFTTGRNCTDFSTHCAGFK
jgi:hypothetical protein